MGDCLRVLEAVLRGDMEGRAGVGLRGGARAGRHRHVLPGGCVASCRWVVRLVWMYSYRGVRVILLTRGVVGEGWWWY